MRVVIQRVTEASCKVDGNITGKIDKGFLVFVGFKTGDTLEVFPKMIRKIVGLRIFEDENGKMNKSLSDIGGSLLAISQFTLYGSVSHGMRPSFTEALDYNIASEYYLKFVEELRKENVKVECGIFGADMKISLLNDGPVTILIDSEDL